MPVGEVVVTTVVGLRIEQAFAAFTDGIDKWWRRSPDEHPQATVRFDGTRLVSVSPAGETLLGNVAAWRPPERLELEWQGPHCQSGDVVVVEFERGGAETRVTVRHRRAGLSPASVESAIVGLWWGGLLQRLTLAYRSPIRAGAA